MTDQIQPSEREIVDDIMTLVQQFGDAIVKRVAIANSMASNEKYDEEFKRTFMLKDAIRARLIAAFAAPPQPDAQPIKDHVIRETVDELRHVAVNFHNHQSLRERKAHVVVPVLKAAQPTKGNMSLPEIEKILTEEYWLGKKTFVEVWEKVVPTKGADWHAGVPPLYPQLREGESIEISTAAPQEVTGDRVREIAEMHCDVVEEYEKDREWRFDYSGLQNFAVDLLALKEPK